jgi:hypothetical protein
MSPAATVLGERLQYFIHDDFDAIRMEISGSLLGAAARRAFDTWRRAAMIGSRRRQIVDISYVTEADENGRAALLAWQRHDAHILASSSASRAVLDSIASLTAGSSASAEAGSVASAEAIETNAENAGLPALADWNPRCDRDRERSNGRSERKYEGAKKCFRRAS